MGSCWSRTLPQSQSQIRSLPLFSIVPRRSPPLLSFSVSYSTTPSAPGQPALYGDEGVSDVVTLALRLLHDVPEGPTASQERLPLLNLWGQTDDGTTRWITLPGVDSGHGNQEGVTWRDGSWKSPDQFVPTNALPPLPLGSTQRK